MCSVGSRNGANADTNANNGSNVNHDFIVRNSSQSGAVNPNQASFRCCRGGVSAAEFSSSVAAGAASGGSPQSRAQRSTADF